MLKNNKFVYENFITTIDSLSQKYSVNILRKKPHTYQLYFAGIINSSVLVVCCQFMLNKGRLKWDIAAENVETIKKKSCTCCTIWQSLKKRLVPIRLKIAQNRLAVDKSDIYYINIILVSWRKSSQTGQDVLNKVIHRWYLLCFWP